MTKTTLSLQLNQLREMVSVDSETLQILRLIDSMINAQFLSRYEVSDSTRLTDNLKHSNQKVKSLLKQNRQLSEILENMRADLKSLTHKYGKLENEMKSLRKKIQFERLRQIDIKNESVQNFGIQCEILSHIEFEQMKQMYQNQKEEKEALSILLKGLAEQTEFDFQRFDNEDEELEDEQSTMMSNASFTSESVSETDYHSLITHIQNPEEQVSFETIKEEIKETTPSNLIDLVWNKSKMVWKYLKSQY